jgi:hypothetical protein
MLAWQNYFITKRENPIFHTKTLIMGNILYIIAVILIVGWLLGMFAFHVTGGLIHALLVIAVIMIIINLVSGRRV